jgi:hypothetical protein
MPAIICAAAKEHHLLLTESPLPHDASLCSYEAATDRYHYNGTKLLTRSQIYIGDALRMAKLCRLTQKLEPLYSLGDLAKEINAPVGLTSIACYLADCSAQLGDYFLNKYKDRAGMSFEEQQAFIQLLSASKAAITARKQSSSTCYLDECQDLRCPTAHYKNPSIRKAVTKLIVGHFESTPAICCFFASGSLKREYKILQKMAEQAPETVVLIDHKYIRLINILAKHTRYIEYTRDSDNVKPDYKEHFAELILNNQGTTTTTDFVLTLQAYTVAHTLNQFRKLAHNLCQNLANITVYGDVSDYIKRCNENPTLKSQLLIGCDFKDSTAEDLTPTWRHLLTCYQQLRDNCLTATAKAWSLTTVDQVSAKLTLEERHFTTHWNFDIMQDIRRRRSHALFANLRRRSIHSFI